MDPELYAIFIKDFAVLADAVEVFAKKWGDFTRDVTDESFTPEQLAEVEVIARRVENLPL